MPRKKPSFAKSSKQRTNKRSAVVNAMSSHAGRALPATPNSADTLFEDKEKAAEEAGLARRLQHANINLAEEKIKEIRSIRFVRNVFLCLTPFVFLSVLSIFYYVLFLAIKFKETDKVPATFIGASFILSFGLLAIILKGIFSACAKQEEKESGLPENVKLVLETMKNIKGGGGD